MITTTPPRVVPWSTTRRVFDQGAREPTTISTTAVRPKASALGSLAGLPVAFPLACSRRRRASAALAA